MRIQGITHEDKERICVGRGDIVTIKTRGRDHLFLVVQVAPIRVVSLISGASHTPNSVRDVELFKGAATISNVL